MLCSATARELAPAARATVIPRASAAAASMPSMPAPCRDTTRRCGAAASITSPLIRPCRCSRATGRCSRTAAIRASCSG